ncbi:carbohydrate kinase family protein [Candidatus Curtissbacteria bacterium]|nr:carbohydrate kinase family protein [Candidatus Curtissbacteria bacterium]
MDKIFELITIGDSTVDTFLKIRDATVECDINHEDCKICVKYGSKIPVDSIGHGVAGNAANVAVACSRLGLKCAIYTNLGDDEPGKSIFDELIRQQVAPDYIRTNPGKNSNLSVVMTYQGERTIFVYHQDWYYKLPNLASCSWVYLTSMAESFTNSNIMDEVCHYIDKSRAKLAFGPGTYHLKASVARFPKILERCQVLFVNLEEAKTILGIDEAEKVNVRDLLSKMLLLGPKTVVITDGEEGSYATDGQVDLKVGILSSQVIEKTGAGDAYASGFISALFLGRSLAEAMVWGTINASYVIRTVGAQNGLLTREQLIKYRGELKGLTATKF